MGIVKWNVVPRPRCVLGHNRPPGDRMMERLMDSPIPVAVAWANTC
jgi:hypothetical protein